MVININNLYILEYRWIFLHFICHMPAFAYLTYFIILITESFVPMQGRSNPNTNPDFFIGSLTCLVAIAQYGLIAPLVCIVRRPFVVLTAVACVFLASLVFLSTPVAFPYRSETAEQRISVYVGFRSSLRYD